MTLAAEYLQYPRRRHGMDHDRYEWSNLFARRGVEWPDGARVALIVSPALEWFPLDMGTAPFAPPGGLARPYPDYWNYTYRDYGNRVGAFRLFQVLDQAGIRASVTVNSAVADRYPALVPEVTGRDWEVIASGVDMGHLHHGGLTEDEEQALVRESLGTLRRATGQPVRGWWSPANSASERTLDLVAAEGVEYVCDWVNDDLPYALDTSSGPVFAMPHSAELSDRQILLTYHHSTQEFVDQLVEQCTVLRQEAEQHGGRVMSVTLHPWLSGQPHRVKFIREAFARIMGQGGIWSATAAEVLTAFKAQA